jgi:UDP-apiose/xylose synthase
VLGGGGFLGSHLVSALLEREALAARVTAIDTTFDKLHSVVPEHLDNRLELVQASIQDPGVLEDAVAGCELVLSLTALCNPALYNTRPQEVIEANFTHLVPLVELCAAHRRWLIHFSTCEVYGKPQPGSGSATLNEDHSPLVLGPVSRERWTYACAKQLLERLIWACGRHRDLPFTIIRPFNVIGPRMDFLDGFDGQGTPRVLACFMRALLLGEPLPLVDGGRQRRSFIYVSDLTDAVVRLIERPECRGEIINIGNPENDVTIAELAERMAAVFRQRHAPDKAIVSAAVPAESFYGPGYDDAEYRVPDIDKATRLLGWRPVTSLDQMLPVIVDDYVSRYGGGEGADVP